MINLRLCLNAVRDFCRFQVVDNCLRNAHVESAMEVCLRIMPSWHVVVNAALSDEPLSLGIQQPSTSKTTQRRKLLHAERHAVRRSDPGIVHDKRADPQQDDRRSST